MAKRDRNKRAARKARQQERERVAAARSASGVPANVESKSSQKKSKTPKLKVAKADRQGITKVTGYFSDVRSEMRQVTWPSRSELRNYTLATIIMLIVFGALLWLVDTGFVAAMVQFTGLRG